MFCGWNVVGWCVCYVCNVIEGGDCIEWEIENDNWLGKFKFKEYLFVDIKKKIKNYVEWIKKRWWLV